MLRPFSMIQSYWQVHQSRWLAQRIAAGIHTLNRRSVFILPTRQGFYLAFFLLCMLVACINYNLSLGYLLTFFVFSVALGAMHRTHQNILGLKLEILPISPTFAGTPCILVLRISHANAASQSISKYGLQFELKKEFETHVHEEYDDYKNSLDLSVNYLPIVPSTVDGEAVTIELPLDSVSRGEYVLPPIKVSSTYPLGLWRAWSYVLPDVAVSKVLVYPEIPPADSPTLLYLPLADSVVSELQAVSTVVSLTPTGDSVSHLESSETPALRSLHWAALARGLVAQRVLEGDMPPAANVLLSFSGCTVQGLEAQLSQLCTAVLNCQQHAIAFVLQLDATRYPAQGEPRSDTAHINQCLAALARYPHANH